MVYGKFTDRAQQVILGAQKESQSYRHGYIGTEHILLGIILEGGYAKEILEKYDVDIDKARELVESYLGYGETLMPKGELLLTPRTKKLFDSSFVEAKKFNHKYVTPEHLLLCLVKEKEGVGYTILSQLKVNFTEVIEELNDYLKNIDSSDFNDKDVRKASNSKTPLLNQYSRDLTELARQQAIDPVIGRESENQRILEILCRRIKNNP